MCWPLWSSLSSLFFLGVRVCVCRTIAMRLSSLGVLMASVFITINACTPGGSAQASGNGTNVTTAMPVVTSTPSNMTSSCQPVRESCFWPKLPSMVPSESHGLKSEGSLL